MSFDLKWFCCRVNSPDTLSLSLTLSANVACIPETHVPAWKILVVSEATYLRLFEGGCLWSFDLKWFCCMVNSPRHSLSISHAFRKCCVYSRNSRARLENSSGQGGDLSTSIRRRMSLKCSGTLNISLTLKILEIRWTDWVAGKILFIGFLTNLVTSAAFKLFFIVISVIRLCWDLDGLR